MTDTPLETINALKKAHAIAVLDKFAEVATLIDSEPDLWFGGLPTIFDELKRVMESRVASLRTTFGIEVQA